MNKCFIFLLFLTVIGCEYVPEGEYIVNNSEPIANPIQINLNLNQDTIYLFQNENFTFTANTGDYKIKYIEIFFDNSSFKHFTSNECYFELDPKYYSNGTHILKAIIKTSTSSNSINDVYGSETFTFIKEWKIIIDNAPPSQVNLIKVTPTNNTIKINWSKYRKRNFKNYSVYAKYKNSYFQKIKDIYNQNDTSCIDSLYIGDLITYYNRQNDLYKKTKRFVQKK